MEAGRAAPLTILLIEDERPVRTVVARLLTSLGHTVIQAANGREGLGQLEAGVSVDVVLTDLRMPDMSGWEVVTAVRARWPGLRVGIITGTPQALAHQPEPVDLVIPKPVTVQELRDAIRRLRPPVSDREADEGGRRLEALRRYLEESFPERRVLGPVGDPLTGTSVFTLPGDPPYHLAVWHEFLRAHRPDEMGERLREWGVASLVRSLPRRRVTVTRAGVRLDRA